MGSGGGGRWEADQQADRTKEPAEVSRAPGSSSKQTPRFCPGFLIESRRKEIAGFIHLGFGGRLQINYQPTVNTGVHLASSESAESQVPLRRRAVRESGRL